MSTEKKIDQLVTLFRDILMDLAKPAAKGAAAAKEEPAPTGRGRGRPAGSKNKPQETLDDDDLGEEEDELGGEDDLGEEEEEEEAYDFKTVRAALVKIRDHGGEKANVDDVKRVMKKFGLGNFSELTDADTTKLNEVMAYIKQIAAKKKISL